MKRFLSVLLLSFILAFQTAEIVPLAADTTYVLNTNTKKFHRLGCPDADRIKPKNRRESNDPREEIIKEYKPCAKCNP